MRIERLAKILTVSALVAVACSSSDAESPTPTPPDGPQDVAGDESPGATETNVARAQCMGDDDCPSPLRCIPLGEGDPLGACVGDAGSPDGGG